MLEMEIIILTNPRTLQIVSIHYISNIGFREIENFSFQIHACSYEGYFYSK